MRRPGGPSSLGLAASLRDVVRVATPATAKVGAEGKENRPLPGTVRIYPEALKTASRGEVYPPVAVAADFAAFRTPASAVQVLSKRAESIS